MILNSILSFLVLSSAFVSKTELQQIRSLYEKAYHSEEDARFFADYLSNLDIENNNVVLGYRASAQFYLSKYAWNPFQKFKHFNKGKDLMEKAIENQPDNSELRFLRLAVQENIPSFLFYSDNLEEDKTYILNTLNSLNDQDLKKRISMYLMDSDLLSESEKENLYSYLNESEHLTKTASLDQ